MATDSTESVVTSEPLTGQFSRRPSNSRNDSHQSVCSAASPTLRFPLASVMDQWALSVDRQQEEGRLCPHIPPPLGEKNPERTSLSVVCSNPSRDCCLQLSTVHQIPLNSAPAGLQRSASDQMASCCFSLHASSLLERVETRVLLRSLMSFSSVTALKPHHSLELRHLLLLYLERGVSGTFFFLLHS